MFFEKHAELLESFIELKFDDLGKGYFNLLTFYSSYSYYLRDGSLINETIVKERDNLLKDNIYKNLKFKISNSKRLTSLDMLNKNEIFFENLINIFEKFEEFCGKLAPDSIMPDLTNSITEYERNVLFASYETFYENFFNFHAKIGTMLNKFSIINFLDIFKSLMAFFYGYSYYLSNYVKADINNIFNNLWDKFNNKKTIELLYKLISNNIRDKELEKLKEIQQSLFIDINKIFDNINNDLPKKNLMPKKKEKVNIDMTGI